MGPGDVPIRARDLDEGGDVADNLTVQSGRSSDQRGLGEGLDLAVREDQSTERRSWRGELCLIGDWLPTHATQRTMWRVEVALRTADRMDEWPLGRRGCGAGSALYRRRGRSISAATAGVPPTRSSSRRGRRRAELRRSVPPGSHLRRPGPRRSRSREPIRVLHRERSRCDGGRTPRLHPVALSSVVLADRQQQKRSRRLPPTGRPWPRRDGRTPCPPPIDRPTRHLPRTRSRLQRLLRPRLLRLRLLRLRRPGWPRRRGLRWSDPDQEQAPG